MQPRIQYAKTPDGVSIAYWTMGSGPPLIHMPPVVWSHIQLELENDEWRGWHEVLSIHRTLVRYDLPGTGLSDREPVDFSVERQVTDLHALVEHLGTDKVSLFAPVDSGPAAIQYTAEHPDRISHLLLYCSYSSRSQHMGSGEGFKGASALLEQNWEVYTETATHVSFGWDRPERAHWWAEYLRESISWEAFKVLAAARKRWDASDFLARVASPTLVIHRRGLTTPEVSAARTLAAKIPDAQLLLMEGSESPPYLGDMEGLARAIDEYLDDGPVAETASTPDQSGAVHTILFTDVEGSTALTQRLGDAKARELLREHERMVREALKAHGGSEVKTMGDGFMASFSSATKALECAIAMQRAFAEHNESAEEPILVRVGLNAGEPIAEDDDLFGTAVNEAARITAAAKGGEILVSNVVRELTKGKDFFFSDRGEASLKGFDEPVRLFEVRWREAG